MNQAQRAEHTDDVIRIRRLGGSLIGAASDLE